MPTYKEEIRCHVQELLDGGLTQAELAKNLGLEHPNFLSMVLNPKHPTTLLPPGKLPALQQICALSNLQSLRLFRLACSPSGGKKSMRMDPALFDWLVRVVVAAKKESDAKHMSAAKSLTTSVLKKAAGRE